MTKTKRIDWIDYAKGITIILVVFHHAIGTDPVYESGLGNALQDFNELLIYFRMPFFIFIAGLFIKKALDSELGSFLEKKVFHFLYLYVLWSLIKTLLVPVAINLAQGDVGVALGLIDPQNFVGIFISPPDTLWFIYALFIFFVVMRLCRRVPFPVIFAVAALIYVFSTTAHGATPPFYQRIGHLFPFFVLGYFGSLHVRRFAEEVKPYFLLVVPLYALTAWWLLAANIGADVLIFGAELLGITAGVVSAKLIATLGDSSLRTIKYVGAHSLAVYLGHFFPILLVRTLAERGLISAEQLGLGLEFTLGILLPILLFKLSQRYGWMWLFRMPEAWRVRRRAPELGGSLEGR